VTIFKQPLQLTPRKPSAEKSTQGPERQGIVNVINEDAFIC